MKTNYLQATIFIAFGLFFSFSAHSQSATLVLQPGPSEANDVSYGNNSDFLAADAMTTDFGATQWTCGGEPCELRSLIKFNLNAIPTNAVITNATLSLYANPTQFNGNIELGPTYGTNNSSSLYPITTAWNSNSLSWENQPDFTNVNAIVIPRSFSNFDDYDALDVTAAVQTMVNYPFENFGWILMTNAQNRYNCMIFCSGDYPDATKRPKLTITYRIGNCDTLSPGPQDGIDLSYGNNPDYLSPDFMSTDFGAAQWTCGGTPCESRALIKFDLSAFTPNAVLRSASLSLYANPAQLTGNPDAGPTYGSNNATDLLKVVSPWSTNTVNWDNQPLVSTADVVTLMQSSTNYEDYLNIDVTAIAQEWINNPLNNYGWMLKTPTAEFYNCMIFGSSNFPDSSKRPTLTLCFESLLNHNTTAANNNQLTLTPNPAHSDINLSLSSTYTGIFKVNIINLLGQIIYTENAEKVGAMFNSKLNVSAYPTGLYVMQIVTPTANYSKRFYIN